MNPIVKRIFVSASVAVVFIALPGCSWLFGGEGLFRNKGDDYRAAKVTDRITVPEGLDSTALDDLLVIPPTIADSLQEAEFEVPRPTPLLDQGAADLVRIQKLDRDRWVLVDITPAQAWPRIRNFLLANRIVIESESPSNGLIETSWLSLRDEPERREKYRFRMEQGVQSKSAEVHVLHIDNTRPEYAGDLDGDLRRDIDWPKHSVNPAREEWMVGELANYFAAVADEKSVSLLAQGISSTSKMIMEKDASGQLFINLKLPFERAWASVGYALSKANFAVTDMDRNSRVYYVSYDPDVEEEEEDSGFFSKLFGFGDDEDEMHEILSQGQYEVRLQQLSDGVAIRLLKNNAEFEQGEDEQLLRLIKGYLS